MKIRSKIHRQFVSQQPCIITGSTYGVQAHHLLRVEGKGLSTKSCDRWVIPLHYVIHDALHKNGNEVAFFANHGFDYETIKALATQFCMRSPCEKIRNLTKG